LFSVACQKLIGFECNKFFISIRPISPVEIHTMSSGLAAKYFRKVHRAYGPEAVKVTDDVSTDDLNKFQEEFNAPP
jgi:hypothetical protein